MIVRPLTKLSFLIASAATILCWYLLYKSYSLFTYFKIPYFAMDKIPGHYQASTLHLTTALIIILSGTYIIGYYLLKSVKKITTSLKLIIIFSILAVGIINVFIYPVGQSDIFTYIIESKLFFFYHQNPYLTTFQNYFRDPLFYYTGFSNLPLVYGPAWLLLSAIPFVFVGFKNLLYLLLSYKIFSFFCLIIIAAVIFLYEDNENSKWKNLYLFALNPFILFEAVTNGHNDIVMTVFLVGAVFLFKKKSWLALAFLVLSGLVKYFSFILIPLFILLTFKAKWPQKIILKSAFASFLIGAILSSTFFIGAGQISNFIYSISASLNIKTYSIFSLIREYILQSQSNLSSFVPFLWAFLALLFTLFYFFKSTKKNLVEKPILSMADLLLLFLILLTLFQPWYLIPVISLFILTDNQALIWFVFLITFADTLFYPLSVWAWFNSGLTLFNIHLFQSFFVTMPVIFYFLYSAIKGFFNRPK